MWRWRSSRTLVVGTAIIVFVVCCVLPVVYLFAELLNRLPFGAPWLDARRRGLMFNTVILGIGTAGLCTAIGAPLGILLGRVHVSRKTPVRLVLAAPALLPPYVVALAWIYLGVLGEWTYSLPAAILVLSLVLYPLSMLATEVAVRRIDGRLEEAALVFAPPANVVHRISLPLIAPSIVAAALLIFVLAVSEFGVPGLLRIRVYTTEVFTAFAALYDVSSAIALTVPLLILCTGVAALAVLLVGERLVGRRALGARHPELFERWRRPTRVFAVIVAIAGLGVPLMILAREAVGIASPSRVFAGSGGAIANSLVYSLLGATLVVSVAVWLGYSRARARREVGRLIDVLYVVMFAVPSTVIGVGLIGFWNREGILGSVYGTHGMFLIADLARFIPLAALILSASSRYVSSSHEEAAAVSGAGWARTMARIVLPQMRPGIAAAWMIVFVMAFGELGVSILIAPPGDATLPIRIYTMIANAPSSQVAAFALLQVSVILAGVWALAALAARREAA